MLKNTRFFKRTMSSQLGKAFWILFSAILMFVGPTYFELVLKRHIRFPYMEITSIVFFLIGLYIFLQVAEEK